MVPVVVAALRQRSGILAIEQPELHIHPAIQVGLGDLFIRAVRPDPDLLFATNTLLIETHSEHIMLRLLRRIRETSEGNLPPGISGLNPDDLSVVYVESNEEGVQFQQLRIDQTGEFLDRWPRGFFEERAEELF
jgi:predicted ATPase